MVTLIVRWLYFQGDLISQVTQLTGLISCTLLLYTGLSWVTLIVKWLYFQGDLKRSSTLNLCI